MNEHVFCLKMAIDDFKHESAKFYSVMRLERSHTTS